MCWPGQARQQGERPSDGSAQAASEFLRALRKPLMQDISHWTGLHEHIVRSLIEHFIVRAQQLSLWLHESANERTRTKLTVYATTLCMNRLYKGDFIIK